MTENEPKGVPSLTGGEYKEMLVHGRYNSDDVKQFCEERGIPLDRESVEIIIDGEIAHVCTRENDFGTMNDEQVSE